MKEKRKAPSENIPNAGSDIFDAAAPATTVEPPVAVSSGPYVEHLPVSGLPVGEIRKRFKVQLDIAPTSIGVLDGTDVGDDVVVKPGQMLNFIHRAGEKG